MSRPIDPDGKRIEPRDSFDFDDDYPPISARPSGAGKRRTMIVEDGYEREGRKVRRAEPAMSEQEAEMELRGGRSKRRKDMPARPRRRREEPEALQRREDHIPAEKAAPRKAERPRGPQQQQKPAAAPLAPRPAPSAPVPTSHPPSDASQKVAPPRLEDSQGGNFGLWTIFTSALWIGCVLAFAIGFFDVPLTSVAEALAGLGQIDPRNQMMILAAALGPLAFIWLAAVNARRARGLKAEAQNLQRLADAILRNSDGAAKSGGASLVAPQGALDPRAVRAEAEQAVKALDKLNSALTASEERVRASRMQVEEDASIITQALSDAESKAAMFASKKDSPQTQQRAAEFASLIASALARQAQITPAGARNGAAAVSQGAIKPAGAPSGPIGAAPVQSRQPVAQPQPPKSAEASPAQRPAPAAATTPPPPPAAAGNGQAPQSNGLSSTAKAAAAKLRSRRAAAQRPAPQKAAAPASRDVGIDVDEDVLEMSNASFPLETPARPQAQPAQGAAKPRERAGSKPAPEQPSAAEIARRTASPRTGARKPAAPEYPPRSESKPVPDRQPQSSARANVRRAANLAASELAEKGHRTTPVAEENEQPVKRTAAPRASSAQQARKDEQAAPGLRVVPPAPPADKVFGADETVEQGYNRDFDAIDDRLEDLQRHLRSSNKAKTQLPAKPKRSAAENEDPSFNQDFLTESTELASPTVKSSSTAPELNPLEAFEADFDETPPLARDEAAPAGKARPAASPRAQVKPNGADSIQLDASMREAEAIETPPPPPPSVSAGAKRGAFDWSKFVKAANFPDGEEDVETLDALYAVLTDKEAAGVLQSAEDALSALADIGLFMEDMRPKHAPVDLWRRFIVEGDEQDILDLGGIMDPHAIEDVVDALEAKADLQHAAKKFLERYEAMLGRLFSDANDPKMAVELADTRTGRAYMLLGRSSGRFG